MSCLGILLNLFLTSRPQAVRMGSFPHFPPSVHTTNTKVKSADNTTVVGLITKGDESAYREEVQRLAEWCSENNLSLNI